MSNKYRLDVWQCKCEIKPCYYLELVNIDRDPCRPNFCTKDGNGSRWTKANKLPAKVIKQMQVPGHLIS